MIEEAFQTFGKNSFQNAIFYSNVNSLRFELSKGESYVEMFTTALEKSTKILETVFQDTQEISICLTFYGDTYLSCFNTFKQLINLQIEIPKNAQSLKEKEDGEDFHKIYIFFKTNKSELQKLLFGKLGAELGIKPSFSFGLYIYDIKLNVLFHPYDDRGMDVVGPNKLMLKGLYKQYNDWLLEYDLEVMNRWFNAL